jgi:hypothetical protein
MEDTVQAIHIDAYARQADEIERGPQTYGGSKEIAGLRAFRAYHPAARVTFLNVDGRSYWLTSKQMRVKAIVDRLAASGQPMSSLGSIAKEAGVTAGYASKVIVRLRQWAMIGAVSVRGRFGGIYVWRIKKAVRRVARAISGFNVSSVYQGGDTKVYTEETLTAKDRRAELISKPWTAEELAEVGL